MNRHHVCISSSAGVFYKWGQQNCPWSREQSGSPWRCFLSSPFTQCSSSKLLPVLCQLLGPEQLASDLTLGSSAICSTGWCISPLTSGRHFWLQIPPAKIRPDPTHSPRNTVFLPGTPLPSFSHLWLCLPPHPPPREKWVFDLGLLKASLPYPLVGIHSTKSFFTWLWSLPNWSSCQKPPFPGILFYLWKE